MNVPEPAASGPRAGRSGPAGQVTIALAGDTMLGRGVGAQITRSGWRGLFGDRLRGLVASADLAVLNLECCVSARGEPWASQFKAFHFRAPPQAVKALARLGVDAVTLANNHVLDYGYAALADTLALLHRAGIATAGAGMDAGQARAPARLRAGGTEIALLGIADHPADFAATADRPGIAYADLREGVPGWMLGQVASEAAGGRTVLVMPHWGPNMSTEPAPYIRAAARALLHAGATLVAGTSAHVFHGMSGPVLYDLGDFIDDYATDPDLRNDLGLLFLVRLAGGEVRRVEAVPLRLDYARTEVASGADRAWAMSRFTRACARLGTSARAAGDRLVVELGPG